MRGAYECGRVYAPKFRRHFSAIKKYTERTKRLRQESGKSETRSRKSHDCSPVILTKLLKGAHNVRHPPVGLGGGGDVAVRLAVLVEVNRAKGRNADRDEGFVVLQPCDARAQCLIRGRGGNAMDLGSDKNGWARALSGVNGEGHRSRMHDKSLVRGMKPFIACACMP